MNTRASAPAVLPFAVALLFATLPRAVEADWVATAFLGAAHTTRGDVVLAQPTRGTAVTLDGVEYEGRSFESPPYYGVRVAYFPSWFGVEAEFVHAKVYARVERRVLVTGTYRGERIDERRPMSDVIQRLSISHGLNFLLVNGAARLPLPRGNVVVRAGLGPTIVHGEGTIDGLVMAERYASGGVGVQAGAALELTIGRHLMALGEYKFTRTAPALEVPFGQAEVEARSHHLAFGLGWRF